MEPIAADEMVIEYVGQNIRQVLPPSSHPACDENVQDVCGQFSERWFVCRVTRWWRIIGRSGMRSRASGAATCSEWTTTPL